MLVSHSSNAVVSVTLSVSMLGRSKEEEKIPPAKVNEFAWIIVCQQRLKSIHVDGLTFNHSKVEVGNSPVTTSLWSHEEILPFSRTFGVLRITDLA